MPMTPKQLLEATPPEIHDRSTRVALLDAKRHRLKSGRIRITAKVSSEKSPNVKYNVIIQTLKAVDAKGRPVTATYNQNVRVWCSCHFFLWYGCGDVLAKRDAGFVKKATGVMPDERNPAYIPFVCKHVIRALKAAIRGRK